MVNPEIINERLREMEENRWPKPKDNQEAVETLARHKIIPPDFARTILPMAGLRNLLVHEYARIDPALIYQHCQSLADFRTFQKYIVKFLNK